MIPGISILCIIPYLWSIKKIHFVLQKTRTCVFYNVNTVATSIPQLILGLRPANERRRYFNDASHWLAANLVSALYSCYLGDAGQIIGLSFFNFNTFNIISMCCYDKENAHLYISETFFKQFSTSTGKTFSGPLFTKKTLSYWYRNVPIRSTLR